MKLKDLSTLILEQILTQSDMKKIYDDLPEEEYEYIKKPVKLSYRIVKDNPEKVETKFDGKLETTNTAKVGDWILTGVKGEKYVLSEKKVLEKYKIIDATTIEANPSKIKAKKFSGKKMEFKASWGELMVLEPGDFLVSNDDEFYRIEKNAFRDLYARNR